MKKIFSFLFVVTALSLGTAPAQAIIISSNYLSGVTGNLVQTGSTTTVGQPMTLDAALNGSFVVPLIDPLEWTITSVQINFNQTLSSELQSFNPSAKLTTFTYSLSSSDLPISAYNDSQNLAGFGVDETLSYSESNTVIFNESGPYDFSAFYGTPGSNPNINNLQSGPNQLDQALIDYSLTMSSLTDINGEYLKHEVNDIIVEVIYELDHINGLQPDYDCYFNVTGDPCPGGLGNNSSVEAFMYSSTVPVPAAGWLFGSALVGLVGFKRRR